MSRSCPHVLLFSSSGLLASVPTLVNLIEALQQSGARVTVVSPSVEAALPRALEDTAFVDVRTAPHDALGRMVLRVLGSRVRHHTAEVTSLSRAVRDARPDAVVVVDGASCLAATLAVPPRIPLVYQSLELLIGSELHGRYWPLVHAFERGVVRRARVIIVQDADRAFILERETGLSPERVVLVPNAPRGPARRAHGQYWHERFALPAHARVVLYAGSWAPWACLDEIVSAVPSWASPWHLVVHARHRPADVAGLEGKLRALGLVERVHLSTEPVSADEMRPLFDGADVGIAFYRPGFSHPTDGENLRVLGASAGKVASLAQAGVPIITNMDTSLAALIPSFHAGWAVLSAAGIAGVLDEEPATRMRFSDGALALYARHFDPEPGLARAVSAIRTAAHGRDPHEPEGGATP